MSERMSGRVTVTGVRLKRDIKNLIAAYWLRSESFPTATWLAKQTRLPVVRIAPILVELHAEDFLEREGNSYRMVKTPARAVGANPEMPKPAKPPETKPQKSKQVREAAPRTTIWDRMVLGAIRVVLISVGVGSAALSIHFTCQWLSGFLEPWWAALLATIMVMFAVSAFETVMLLWQRSSWFAAGVFAVLWTVTTVFSMTSTVAVLFENRTDVVVVVETARAEGGARATYLRRRWDALETSEADAETEMDLKSRETETYIIQIGEFSLQDQQERRQDYLDAQWRRILAERRLTEIRAELKQIRTDKSAFLEETAEETITETREIETNFYTWLGGILGGPAESWQFWLSVFPATFVDLVMPLSLAVALFVRRRDDEG